MRVLFATSEIAPLAKTGGLADVSAGLPAALSRQGVDVRIVMPAYPEALERAIDKGTPQCLPTLMGFNNVSLIPARTPDTGLPIWLVRCPSLYTRHGGLYLDSDGREWPDNAIRFGLFCHAVTQIALGATPWTPEVVHVNDWHLGLVPLLLKTANSPLKPVSLFTIHNLAFQGLCDADLLPRLDIPANLFTPDAIEFFGKVSFLKAGIQYADRITTVSPRYAREILTPEFGAGLDGLLRTRASDIVGILNGIDEEVWTPQDATLECPYNAQDTSGKVVCKRALQDELGLEAKPVAPLYAFVSRITEQKMADVLPSVVPAILASGGQLAVLGRGDSEIETDLLRVAAAQPERVSVRIAYSDNEARRVLAGADVLMAPARFEPCGLTQMYGMRYGAIPIVRSVGGLAETVTHATEDHDAQTGFVFDEPTAADFTRAICQAASKYHTPPSWDSIQHRAMAQDFSWRRSSKRYIEQYRTLLADTRPELTRQWRSETQEFACAS